MTKENEDSGVIVCVHAGCTWRTAASAEQRPVRAKAKHHRTGQGTNLTNFVGVQPRDTLHGLNEDLTAQEHPSCPRCGHEYVRTPTETLVCACSGYSGS